jgi:hypothetical protein
MIAMRYSTFGVALGLLTFSGLSAGCAAIGNVFFSPHPESLTELPRGKEPELSFHDVPCIGAPHAQGAAIASGVAIAAVQGLLEAESARYEATWSGSGSTPDLLQSGCIKLDGKQYGVLELALDASDVRAFQITDGTFQAKGARSKVVSWPVRMWWNGGWRWPASVSGKIGSVFGTVNPLMWAHFVWSLFDDGAYSVEYAAKLRVESIGTDHRSTVASVVIPIGKISVDDMAEPDGYRYPKQLRSGYFVRPAGALLPTNVTATIVESGDLGDVIGRGADLVGENKRGILAFFGF